MNANRGKALIIGGGIAGPAVAIALQRVGLTAEIYEAKSTAADEAGAFLNLAPNGVNALKTLGVAHRLEAKGFSSRGIVFFNSNGKRIGKIDSSLEEERYGARNMMLKRGHLHQALRQEAMDRGIPVAFGKRLKEIEHTGQGPVVARFEDDTTASGEFTYYPAELPAWGEQHMTFGKRAFFGYIVSPDGEVWWFSNVPYPQEPTRDELSDILNEDWQRWLLALHSDDPAPIPEIIRSTEGIVGKWPVYDLPFLPTWHKGPVCLLGDAAHATSPHIGQGASLALEDAIVLARCLRDIPGVEPAFAAYQSLRKERVEALIKQARRTGDRKIPGPVAGWFRDLTLPWFLKAGTSSLGRVYSYKVDWDQKVA
jgi:2-polyprenyl-6-methoxyphenol hydroxylase-like FAD-dependent oxidoreductase